MPLSSLLMYLIDEEIWLKVYQKKKKKRKHIICLIKLDVEKSGAMICGKKVYLV